MNRNFKTQLSYANNIGARYALILGDREVAQGLFTFKDMESGIQESLTLDEVILKLTGENN
jgi:histidyl-tRNA synthetase